jgi:hypothetical protein
MGGVSGFDGLDHAGSNCAPPDTKKIVPTETTYVRESAWFQLRQTANHWTTAASLRPGWRYSTREHFLGFV